MFLHPPLLIADQQLTFLSAPSRIHTLSPRFHWSHVNILDYLFGESRATIEWNIAPDVPAGSYRVCHFGHYKSIVGGEVKPYSGTSSAFKVTA